MSFPKKGKSFPKKGKSFPKRGGDGSSDFSLDDHAFAMKIASALTSELKDRNSRAKLVAGWTGANERTVKNWISGRYAPCGRHLVVLAQHSDQVLNAILLMADRQDLLLARSVGDLRRKHRGPLKLEAIIRSGSSADVTLPGSTIDLIMT
jgi:hypothetical protein